MTPDEWPVRGLGSGRRIGNFELRHLYARTDTTVTYKGWDHALDLAVAITEYFPAGLSLRPDDGVVQPVSPEFADRFEAGRQAFVDEWQRLARCDHPSLVRVLHLAQAQGTVYGVTPWYEGQTLRELSQAGRLPLEEAALRRLVDDLLGALDILHHAGAAHGAIGPSTVLWLDEGRALLLAPGGASHGDRAADLPALASLARWCSRGLRPWTTPPTPEGEALRQAIEAALSAEPSERPQTVAAFRECMAAPVAAATAETRIDAPAEAAVDAVAEPPRGDESEDELARRYRRMLDAIPEPAERVGRAQRPAQRPPLRAVNEPEAQPRVEPTLAVDPGASMAAPPRPTAPLTERKRRRSPWPWAVVGLAAGGVVGAATVALLWPQMQMEARTQEQTQTQTQAQAQAEPQAQQPAVTAAGTVQPISETAPTPSPLPSPLPSPPPPPPAMRSEPVAVPTGPTPPEPAAAPAPVAATPAPPVAPLIVARPVQPPAPRAATSPRDECGARTQFSLYRCMQEQCSAAQWQQHPLCIRFRTTDSVD